MTRLALFATLCALIPPGAHSFTTIPRAATAARRTNPTRRPWRRMTSSDADAADDPTSTADAKDAGASYYDGNELTDRFKYKVNALMGSYDPPNTDTDTDRATGNILDALLTFPTVYAFNVVGRTGGDGSAVEAYVKDVEAVVRGGSIGSMGSGGGGSEGEGTEGEVEVVCVVKPRGKNFTKVTVEATVESAAVINSLYEELAALEQTVMRF